MSENKGGVKSLIFATNQPDKSYKRMKRKIKREQNRMRKQGAPYCHDTDTYTWDL